MERGLWYYCGSRACFLLRERGANVNCSIASTFSRVPRVLCPVIPDALTS